jgi:uncharacterized protein
MSGVGQSAGQVNMTTYLQRFSLKAGVLAAGLLLTVTTGFAQDQTAQQPAPGQTSGQTTGQTAEQPAPQPAPAPLAPTHMALAKDVVQLSGTSDTLLAVIPEVLNKVHLGLARTRPELSDALQDASNAVLVQLVPQRDELLNIAATSLAQQIAEPDLKLIADFMNSSAGKLYISKQRLILQNTLLSMQPWNEQLRRTVTKLFKDELLKKGITL